jgi:hypothetical protein
MPFVPAGTSSLSMWPSVNRRCVELHVGQAELVLSLAQQRDE